MTITNENGVNDKEPELSSKEKVDKAASEVSGWWKKGNARVAALHPGKWLDFKNTPHLAKKALFSLIGVLFISIGIAGCKSISNIFGIPVGVDAYTAMNIGISGKIGLSLGV